MSALPFACFAPVDPQGRARRHALQRRMRIASCLIAAAIAILAGAVVQAYVHGGTWLAAGIFVSGSLFLFEAFRRADQAYLAPLQAACQNDYSRQLDILLRPLFDEVEAPTTESARHVDAA
jgi:hypothetical protein